MADRLLSDDFIEYTKRILEIKKKYEEKQNSFKEIYIQQ